MYCLIGVQILVVRIYASRRGHLTNIHVAPRCVNGKGLFRKLSRSFALPSYGADGLSALVEHPNAPGAVIYDEYISFIVN